MLAAGCIFLLASCNSEKKTETTETTAAKKNLESAQTIAKAFQTGDVSMVDSVVAADFVDHTDRGDVIGRDSLKSIIKMVQNMQMKMSVIKEMANETHVFQWLHFTGTSDGKMGMPAGPYDFTEIELVRFQDGKAVEHWALMEPRAMMKMMPGSPSDTSGKYDPAVPNAANKESAGMSTEKSKKNLDAMHAIANMFSTGDFSKLADYMAEDVVDWGAEKSPNKGLANVKADLEKATQNMSDMKSEVIQEVADDEFAMSWMKFTGTMKTDGMGMKAGQSYTTSAIEVARFNADSKCVEHWTFVEMREMMKMMGGMQGTGSTNMPPPPPRKDSVR